MTGAPSARRSGAPRLVISSQSRPAPNIAKIFHRSQGLELMVSSTHGQPTAVNDSDEREERASPGHAGAGAGPSFSRRVPELDRIVDERGAIVEAGRRWSDAPGGRRVVDDEVVAPFGDGQCLAIGRHRGATSLMSGG